MEYKKLQRFSSIDDLYQVYVKIFLALHNITLQPKVEVILRYFIQYGYKKETYDKLLNDKKVPLKQSINNAKTDLKSVGLMIKKPKWDLIPELKNVNIKDFIVFMLKCKIERPEK